MDPQPSSPHPVPLLPEGEGLRFAAVDVGSNALRLLFTQVFDQEDEAVFRKVSLMRMPLRLGTEAFLNGALSADTELRLLQSLQGFTAMLKAWRPLRWRACATSALRSVHDSDELMERLNRGCGLGLECITGEEEAGLILENERNGAVARSRRCLFVDVGGGSTEVTFFGGGRDALSRSFPLGTVRLLHGQGDAALWGALAEWLRSNRPRGSVLSIGSGGNINKLISMTGRPKRPTIGMEEIQTREREISALSVTRRIRELGLRPDRADVLPHALRIYAFCMEHGGARRMMVPRAGLADGLIRKLYDDYRIDNPL